MNPESGLTYRDAGVDIDAGNALVERIKPAIRSTHRAGCVGSIGGFGGLFELPLERYRQPLLVSGTDGVGTKLNLAQDLGRFDGIGIDLVAMCVNDIAVLGAEALFFLDYYSSGQLDIVQAEQVINGIAEGCRQANCALIGGETAEMPGLYATGDFDLAGFCVGIVEREAVIDGSRVTAGDRLIGIASSGPHSNGFSLIRKVIELSQVDLDQDCDGRKLGDTLIEPTRIYIKPLLALAETCLPNAIAHITGGGILENVPRVLPDQLAARIDLSSWRMPVVFEWLRQAGSIDHTEMLRAFNCGVGMVLVVDQSVQATCLERLTELGEQAWDMGEIVPRRDGPPVLLE